MCNQALPNQDTVHSDMPDRTELPRTFCKAFCAYLHIFAIPLRCTLERGFSICGRGQVCLDGKPGTRDVNGVNLGFRVTKPRAHVCKCEWHAAQMAVKMMATRSTKVELKETIRMIAIISLQSNSCNRVT